MVLSGISADAAAEAPQMRKECVLMFVTSGKQCIKRATMSLRVTNLCGVMMNNGPACAGWEEIYACKQLDRYHNVAPIQKVSVLEARIVTNIIVQSRAMTTSQTNKV